MRKEHNSFTLIEMLVTVLVIFIMLGIIFRLMPMISRAAAKGKCVYELQQIRNALNEYYAEYGSYPPVDFMEYEFESATNQTPFFRDIFLPAHNTPGDAKFFGDIQIRKGATAPNDWYLGYRYGLVSYIYPRKQGWQPHWYDEDTARDTAAKTKWNHFIKDIGPDGGGLKGHPSPSAVGAMAPYSNSVATLNDPWGASYKYTCKPPYVRFKLWSVGPDGTDGTSDDIDSAQEQ